MIISVSNAVVTNYYTKSLSADSLDFSPQSEIAIKLNKWFNQNKNKITLPSFETDDSDIVLLNAITIQSIKKGIFFYICKASLIDFKDIFKYDACEKCLKKISFSDDEYECELCKNISTTCKLKLMVKILIVDPSKQIWLTLFETRFDKKMPSASLSCLPGTYQIAYLQEGGSLQLGNRHLDRFISKNTLSRICSSLYEKWYAKKLV